MARYAEGEEYSGRQDRENEVHSEAEYGKGLEVGMGEAAGALRTGVWLEWGRPGGGGAWEASLGRGAGFRC